MWIFSTLGFYSAVQLDEKDAVRVGIPDHVPTREYIVVRARVHEDIMQLTEFMRSTNIVNRKPTILEWEGRDYPYRIIVQREKWAKVLMTLVDLMDYTNFKNAVKIAQNAARALLYSRVWTDMLPAETFLGFKRKNISSYEQPTEMSSVYPPRYPLVYDLDQPEDDIEIEIEDIRV